VPAEGDDAHTLITSAARAAAATARRSDLGLDQHADRAERGRDVVIALGCSQGTASAASPHRQGRPSSTRDNRADPLGADPASSLSPAIALLVNHAVNIVERLGVAVTPAGEVALQAGLPRVHYFLLCDGR
jgi:hypothetical protein